MKGHALLTSCSQTIVILSSLPLIPCGWCVYFWWNEREKAIGCLSF